MQCACLVLALSLTAAAGAGQAQPVCALASSQDFIPRFLQYVRWPHEELSTDWRVCVLAGTDGDEQHEHYAGLSVRGRGFSIVQVDSVEQAGDCHVLDLTGQDPQTVRAFIAPLRQLPVLTVGTGAGFCSAGGLICLIRGQQRSFEINLSAVHTAGLRMNARLLKLAQASSVPRP